MPFKPMSPRDYKHYISLAGWRLEKGGIDWNLYDENNNFVCSIKISHGSTKQEVVAHSVHKTEKEFKKRGLQWPPNKKSKKS